MSPATQTQSETPILLARLLFATALKNQFSLPQVVRGPQSHAFRGTLMRHRLPSQCGFSCIRAAFILSPPPTPFFTPKTQGDQGIKLLVIP